MFEKKVPVEEMELEEIEESTKVSYKRLMNFIRKMHPTDPDTFRKFSFMEDVTVAGYMLKFNNCCNWSQKYRQFKKCKIKSLFLGKPRKTKKTLKPETMADIPSTDSDSE